MIGQYKQASYEARKKFMIILEMIMSISENVITPQSLGLCIYLDNVYGSKELVIIIGDYGICDKYDSLKRYKASASVHTLNSSKLILWTEIPRGRYIPIFCRR